MNSAGSGDKVIDGSGNFEGFFGNPGWSNLVSSTYSDLGLELAAPVQAIGAWVGRIPNFTNEHPANVVVELFDAASASLGSQIIAIPAAFDSPVWFGFAASAPIGRLEIRVNDGGFISVDNVTFGNANVSQVPEPSSIALLGLGLAGCGAGRRLRRKLAVGA